MTGTLDIEARTWMPPEGGWRYENIHQVSPACIAQGCMIHNPDEEWVGNREDWPYFPRADGRMERLCPHGVGHSDPNNTRWLQKIAPHLAPGIHGCDGCCRTPNDINPHFETETS